MTRVLVELEDLERARIALVGEIESTEEPGDCAALTNIEQAIADAKAEPILDGIPRDFWREVPCGHPQDPIAARASDLWVCHCGWFLDERKAIPMEDAPGPVVPCRKCGCHVALAEPSPATKSGEGEERVCDCGHAEGDHETGDPFVHRHWCRKCSCINPVYELPAPLVPTEGPLWIGLKPCRECGAPLHDSYPPRRARGHYWNPEVPLDAYEAINLLEALKLVPDTGDWHGQLRMRCEEVVNAHGSENLKPNSTAEQMKVALAARGER